MSLLGQPAPDFTLASTKSFDSLDEPVSLTDHRGRWLMLFFYPADFTFVCPVEVTGFSQRAGDFAALDCDIVGVSTDSVHCHQAWCEFALGRLAYPLAADTSHAVSRAYDVLDPAGQALRALFLIDPEGIVRYEVVHDDSVARRSDPILAYLSELQTSRRTAAAAWRRAGTPLTA